MNNRESVMLIGAVPAFCKILPNIDENVIEYVKNVDSFIMYIEGFRAAYNMQTEDTYDIFSNLKSDQILAYSNHFCSNNPLKKFTDSIVSLSKENFENRKKKL